MTTTMKTKLLVYSRSHTVIENNVKNSNVLQVLVVLLPYTFTVLNSITLSAFVTFPWMCQV